MKVKTLHLSPDLFVEFAKAAQNSRVARRFIVKANPLPDDAEVIGVRGDSALGHLRPLVLMIQSESFPDVGPDDVPEELPSPVFETLFDRDSAE